VKLRLPSRLVKDHRADRRRDLHAPVIEHRAVVTCELHDRLRLGRESARAALAAPGDRPYLRRRFVAALTVFAAKVRHGFAMSLQRGAGFFRRGVTIPVPETVYAAPLTA
jgi:hypothetical protein